MKDNTAAILILAIYTSLKLVGDILVLSPLQVLAMRVRLSIEGLQVHLLRVSIDLINLVRSKLVLRAPQPPVHTLMASKCIVRRSHALKPMGVRLHLILIVSVLKLSERFLRP